MGKFEEKFSNLQVLSDGSYALDDNLGKQEFIKQYKRECGMVLEERFIETVNMRFGFAPDSVENREDFENKPVWHTCGSDRGIRKALTWSMYQQRKIEKEASV